MIKNSVDKAKTSKKAVAIRDKARKNSDNTYDGKLIDAYTPFGVTEAFNKLRTNLLYTSISKECPIFGITSAFAHAGKSVIISNLAISYTQIGKKVLLIDGDMRCPVLSKLFNLKSEIGLSEILIGKDELFDKEANRSKLIAKYDNLDIITSGRIPPNPSALLSSEKFERFIEHIRKDYDYIFIDLPPICEVTDAGVIANTVDGYIFTVRSGITDQRSVQDAVDKLNNVKANIIGFVINDIPSKFMKTGEKYGGKYKHYKYGRYGRYEHSNKNDNKN